MPVEEEDEIHIVDNNETKQDSFFVSTNDRTIGKVLGQKRSQLSELPFLVTHWLSGYQLENIHDSTLDNNDIKKRNEAVRIIHRAATEIASAFSSLASFGTSVSHVSLNISLQFLCLMLLYGF
jgi:hypothetical protein